MKFLSKIIIPSLVLVTLVLPTVSHAQFPSLIVCGTDENSSGVIEKDELCDFGDLVQLIINLIDFLIILSTFIATAVFAFAGIKLLTSGGNERAMTQAKEMATKVLIGYLWILGAWVLIYTVTKVLISDKYPSFLG